MRIKIQGNGGIELEICSYKTNVEGKSNLEFTVYREGDKSQSFNIYLVDRSDVTVLGTLLQESAL